VNAAGDLRDALIEGREFLRTQPDDHGDVVRAGAPIRGATGDLLGAVVVSYRVPRALADSALEAVRAHEEYRSLRGPGGSSDS